MTEAQYTIREHNVTIRSPRSCEWALLAAMTWRLLEDTGRADVYRFRDVLHGVRSTAFHSKTNQYVLAFVDGDIAGQMKLHQFYHDLHNRMVAMIEHVFIRPEYRGLGLYRCLHQQALTMCRDTSVGLVQLHVVLSNARALRAYEKQGMEKTALLMSQSVNE